MTPEMAEEYLTGRWHTQHGYARQRVSMSQVEKGRSLRLPYATQNGTQLKGYELFISTLFCLIFSDPN
jgi:hypothetical protein